MTHLRLQFLGFSLAIFFIAMATLFVEDAGAVPAFARRYGADCMLCHSPYPRLNNYGQKFRRLGYRLPDEFTQGTPKDGKFPNKLINLGNNLSLRSRFQYRVLQQKGLPRVSEFDAKEVNLYLVGPATDNLSFFFQENLID